MDTKKYRLRGKGRLGERERSRQSWMDGTAVTDIFNERLRTENLCSVTSAIENLRESQANGNLGFSHLQVCLLILNSFRIHLLCPSLSRMSINGHILEVATLKVLTTGPTKEKICPAGKWIHSDWADN